MRWLPLLAFVPLVVLAQMLLPSAASAPRNKHADLLTPTIAKAKQAPQLADGSQQVQQTAMSDTTWFGGTQWDAADQRWEAVLDSVWTFDTGVASAINTDPGVKAVGLHSVMEGWVGHDFTAEEAGKFRRLSEADFANSPGVCVGDVTGVLGGDWSLWAGLLSAEADTACFVDGQGYGNSRSATMQQTFTYSGGAVELAFSYICETEPGYDFVYVFVDTTGTGEDVQIWRVDGSVSARDTLTLSPGTELPSAPGNVVIKFRVTLDGTWSDEDGLFTTTCGAFALDDIEITGGIVHSAGFETGNDGWEMAPPALGSGGDWADIRAISDLPTESEPGWTGCDLGDSVLVFIDDTLPFPGHKCSKPKDIVAVSPWIDLAEAGIVGKSGFVVEYGGFFDLELSHWFLIQVLVQWYPDVCPLSGVNRVSDFTSTGFVFFAPPICAGPNRLYADFTEIIPSDAEEVRIALGLINYALNYLCDVPPVESSTPWFDRVRFGVFDTAGVVVGVPDHPTVVSRPWLSHFSPNPYRGTGRGSLTFALPEEGRARVDIFDIAGRLVNTVYDRIAPAGPTAINWTGTDLTGRIVPNGVYFYRLLAGGKSISRKMVVIRN